MNQSERIFNNDAARDVAIMTTPRGGHDIGKNRQVLPDVVPTPCRARVQEKYSTGWPSCRYFLGVIR